MKECVLRDGVGRPGPALECFVPFEQNRIRSFLYKSGHLINVDPQFAKQGIGSEYMLNMKEVLNSRFFGLSHSVELILL